MIDYQLFMYKYTRKITKIDGIFTAMLFHTIP